jgi:hypothetical protein
MWQHALQRGSKILAATRGIAAGGNAGAGIVRTNCADRANARGRTELCRCGYCESCVKAIGQYTNTTFILDPRVRGTINLVSDGPVSKEQALRLLTSTLRLQGFAVVPETVFPK